MGIEDEIKLEDVLKEPNKLIVAKTYLQAIKTNGTVKNHEIRIIKLEERIENKASQNDIKNLQDESKNYFSLRSVDKVTKILGILLTALLIISSIIGVLNITVGR
jgi:ABC-type antimicrobial peptide transport system permease subunit